jgi:uncharacterized protein YndB with AHSA1/START domain/DNA-binding transcriptional ArsR family regulator
VPGLAGPGGRRPVVTVAVGPYLLVHLRAELPAELREVRVRVGLLREADRVGHVSGLPGAPWGKRPLPGDHLVTYRSGVDEVFRALADPTRRALLDALFRVDGQSLRALEEGCAMTRFGVMKHLRLLEEAGLVVTRRRGREKLHFLNPVPLRLLHDRWVSKYTEPWVAGLVSLQGTLESTSESTLESTSESTSDTTGETTMEKVYEIYVKTTPERLWEAITSAEIRKHFQFGVLFTGDWTAGSRIEMGTDDRPGFLGDGEVLEADPPRRLVHTLHATWSDDVAAEGTSRVTWEISQVGSGEDASCCLTLTHDQLREGAHPEVYGGWPMILSGLKTWLETGEELTTPGSLMYR